MKQIFFLTILITAIIFSLPVFVLANEEHSHEEEIKEGQKLIGTKVSCEQLSDEQLEAIGEYLMEQMHPGESHGAMHQMMAMEEGTEYHKDFHVNMAKMMYCKEGNMMMGNGMTGGMMPGGMMSMMPMMMGRGMMGGNMMGSSSNPLKENLSANANNMNIMSNFGFWPWFGWIFMVLFWVLIIVGIIALIKWLMDSTKG